MRRVALVHGPNWQETGDEDLRRLIEQDQQTLKGLFWGRESLFGYALTSGRSGVASARARSPATGWCGSAPRLR